MQWSGQFDLHSMEFFKFRGIFNRQNNVRKLSEIQTITSQIIENVMEEF